MIAAAEVNESGLRGKFREMQKDCRAVNTKALASLVDAVLMAKLLCKNSGLSAKFSQVWTAGLTTIMLHAW